MNKRGVSEIIVTIIIIAITLVAVGIIWASVRNLTQNNLAQSTSCFQTMDKINLDDKKTCYDSGNNELRFLIGIGDIDLEGVLVSITAEEQAKSFQLVKGFKSNYLKLFADTNYDANRLINPPEKNSGVVYTIKLDNIGLTLGNAATQLGIKIVPISQGKICSEVSDSINGIGAC
jgi:flagellin-like protein